MKIMVVDDDTIVLDSCEIVLKPEGFDVRLVSSANKALKIMEGNRFDLLLIDIKMPEHDGVWLIQEIKKMWPEIPLIVMSGYPTTETIALVNEMGVTSFIAKPFTPDELLESIGKALHED